MTVFPNVVGNFLANTLPTFRLEVDLPTRRVVIDQPSSSNGARIKIRFKKSEIGSQATLTVVASTPATVALDNPFVYPASTGTSVLDLWKSRGCTVGDHTTVTVQVKTGPQSIDVWDSGSSADDAFELVVDGADLGSTVPGGDRLFAGLSLSSGSHNLCVVYVGCSSCDGPGTYAVRLNGGMTFSGGVTEQSGSLDPSGSQPTPPYHQVCFAFRVP